MIHFVSKSIIISIAALLVFLTCAPINNPYECDKTKGKMFLKPSYSNIQSDIEITDTLGNWISCGFNVDMPINVDTVVIKKTSSASAVVLIDTILVDFSSLKYSDTVWKKMQLTDTGNITLTATIILKCNVSFGVSVTVKVLPRKPNNPPTLILPQNISMRSGDICTLAVAATDPDSFQVLTFTTIKLPTTSSFSPQTRAFIWKAPNDFIGTDTAVFKVTDNGYPQLFDQKTVLFNVRTITDTVNLAPKWTMDTVTLSTTVNQSVTLTPYIMCSDLNGDALTYTLIPGQPSGDTIFKDSIYSFTPTSTDTGVFWPRIIAKDPKGLADTLTIRLFVSANVVANHKPSLSVSGIKNIKSGTICTLTAAATDADLTQTLTYSLLSKPTGSTIDSASGVFTWTPPASFKGTDTAVFKVTDNGTPAMSDTETVLILVSDSIINHPPKWELDTVTMVTTVGNALTLSLADKGVDPDGDNVSYNLVAGKPDADTIKNTTYSFMTTSSDTGIFWPRIIVKDSLGLADTLTLKVTVSVGDKKAPYIKLFSPATDSTAVGANSLTVKVICKDESGVASVKCAMGTDTFVVSHTDSIYSVTATGLNSTGMNEILFVATDLSANANKDTLKVHIKYDPTMGDNVPPTVYFIKPAKDTVVGVDSFVVQAVCKDPSKVLSLVGKRDNVAFTLTRATTTDTVWSGTAKGITAGQYSTIKLIATDSSTAKNKDSVTVRIKYDNDVTAPSILQKNGPISGAVVTSPVITITDSIADPSGIDSVYWTRNGVWVGTLSAVNGVVNTYRLRDSLSSFKANKIVIHAIDNSMRHNRDSMVINLTYNTVPQINDTAVVTDKNVNVAITLGAKSTDGDALTWTKITDPLHGSLQGTLPAITYTPASNYSGADEFSVKVSDGVWSDTGVVRITVRSVNYAPVAKDTTIIINEDSPTSFNLSGSDPDGNTLSGWAILKQGTHGTAAIATSPANRVTFTPTANFFGKDTFSFRVSDGTLYDTGFVWVTINSVNDTPVTSKNLVLTVLEGASGIINTSRLDFTDADNATSDIYLTITTAPKLGGLKLSGAPLAVSGTVTYSDLSAGNFQYTHDGSETVADSFQFTVSDGAATRNGWFKFTISPVNDAPTFAKTGSQMKSTCGIGNFYKDTITISDAEGAYSSLTFSAIPSSDAKITYNSSNRTIYINWCIDFNKYAYNQVIPCSLKVVDGSVGAAIGWTITVGAHKWTKILSATDIASHVSGAPDKRIAARDSFTILTGNFDADNSLAKTYRYTFSGTPAWSDFKAVVSGTYFSLNCNGSRLLIADPNYGNHYSYDAENSNNSVDSLNNVARWDALFQTDTGKPFYVAKDASLYENSNEAYILANTDERISGGTATASHAYLAMTNVATSWTGIRRMLKPFAYPFNGSADYTSSFTVTGIYTDKNNADTIYARGGSGEITRILNFPITNSPTVQSVSASPAPTGAMCMYSGSVGWYIYNTELYFTRDAFANANAESFDAGFTPVNVLIPGNKNAVFVVGTDFSVYRY